MNLRRWRRALICGALMLVAAPQVRAEGTFDIPTGARFNQDKLAKITEFFKNEAELRALWSAPDTRAKLLQGLAENIAPDLEAKVDITQSAIRLRYPASLWAMSASEPTSPATPGSTTLTVRPVIDWTPASFSASIVE